MPAQPNPVIIKSYVELGGYMVFWAVFFAYRGSRKEKSCPKFPFKAAFKN